MPLFAPKSASSLTDYIDVLRSISNRGDSPAAMGPGPAAVTATGVPTPEAVSRIRWFRGHAEGHWRLVPGLGRTATGVNAELALVKRFKQNAVALLSALPTDDWHWLFLMQHHGAPTRLLDWSENPLVALFFAVHDERSDSVDGTVWCLDPVALNKAAYIQSSTNGELPFFGIDDELKVYHTDGLIKPSPKPPVAALAPRYFPRIASQAGVFTVHHKVQTPIEECHGGACVGKIAIPGGAKAALRRDLSVIGVTKLALFPELDQVAMIAKGVLE